jgi:hypothetical protein
MQWRIKALAIFSSLVLVAGLPALPASANNNNACDLAGLGTSGAPWEISTVAHLSEIGVGDCTSSYNQNHYYILTADLVLPSPWTPNTDLYSNPGFVASFDGNGKTISGLSITGSGAQVGLFGNVRSAVIKNLVLTGSSVSGGNDVGALVGYANQSTIQNVRVRLTGDVTGNDYVGGIIGKSQSTSISEAMFSSPGKVTGAMYVGGAVGSVEAGSINAVHAETEVIAGQFPGGIVGMLVFNNSLTVEQLFFNGRVYGGTIAAGLIGYTYAGDFNRTLTLRHSAVRGSIETRFNSAPFAFVGLYGQLITNITYRANYINAEFKRCVDAGNCSPSVETNVRGQQTDRSSSYFSNLYSQVGTSTIHQDVGVQTDLSNPANSSFNADWRLTSQEGGAAVDTATYSWVIDTSGARNSGLPFPSRLFNAGLFGTCEAGSYSANGSQPCLRAAPGTYVATRGATASIDCPAGSFQANTGASDCLPAPIGHFVAASGSQAATPCPAGSYQSLTNQSACVPAPAGSSVAQTGQSTATLCPAGSFSTASGSSSCTLAPIGFIAPAAGLTSATACPAGETTAALGSLTCIPIVVAATPTEYSGPVLTSPNAQAAPGSVLEVSGKNLSGVSGASMDGVNCKIEIVSSNRIRIHIPESLSAGRKDLVLESSSGRLTIQGFVVIVEAGVPAFASVDSFRIHRVGDRARLFAAGVNGIGKVQFLHNGREIAWVRAVDEMDPKLFRSQSRSYLVRTRDLSPGQNKFEILVGGKSIRTMTLTAKS